MVHLNLNETDYTWEWVANPVTIGESTYFVATATYNKILAPGALTEISLSQIALDKTATNADVEAFGETYQILVKSQAIQADGFDTAAVALDEGFGEIDDKNIPWETDAATKGDSVYNAVHYLNADATGENIAAKVATVTFGLNKDHAAIVAQNKGALVDVEQDVPVYAYYVDNGSTYDVYLLADDDIYLPKDSNSLFKGMTALKTLNSANLNTGRTENMLEMFRDCTALKSVDVSNWDTSSVTTMKNMFRNCKVLPEIALAKWDVSKVTDMAGMFRECKAVKELDTSKWDVGNVTTFTQTFAICDSLEIVHTSDWDISSATTTSWMFYKDGKLKTVDVSKWDTSNVTDMEYMFINCTQLANLEVGGWDTSKVKSFDHLFASSSQNKGDMKLTKLDVSKWDTGSATEMQCMFYGCGNLTELDLSKWDVSNVTIMTHMFADCYKLKDLNLVGWDTSSLVVMDAIFNDCDALETLDVSTFKTHNVTEFCQVFDDCENLVEIIGLNNWDTSNGCTFEEMFQGCDKLVQLDLSSFNTSNARDNFKGNADTYNAFVSMFSGTNQLEKLILSDKFDFDGNSDTNRRVSFPNPAAKEGYTAKWQNVDTKETYLAKDIPEGVAATYVPYYEYVTKGAT
jgi:surface protein